jgi:hypothetical protein
LNSFVSVQVKGNGQAIRDGDLPTLLTPSHLLELSKSNLGVKKSKTINQKEPRPDKHFAFVLSILILLQFWIALPRQLID